MTENEDGYRYLSYEVVIIASTCHPQPQSEEGLNTSSNQLFGFRTAKLPIYSHYKNYL